MAVVGTAVAAALAGTSLAGVPAASAGATENVIVSSAGVLGPVTAVLQVGGTVLTQYHIINAVDAVIPVLTERLLDSLPGITVTPDATVSVQSTTTESTGPHSPSDAFLQQTGASRLANAGDTGQGMTVAVLDTGIDKLPDFAGRLAGGVDLTSEGNPFQDSYGHGTFVAGLIAGNGASADGQYSGEAPGAKLVSVKVAGANGASHLSTLITGLQWVADHQDRYGIRVLNLSLGYQPAESTAVNPLDQAVEAVWHLGVAVVAAAGNSGPFNGSILSPGDDPLVITVGALDDMASASVAGDEMNDFSAAGPTTPDGWVKPDLVTSGRSVVSLAAPGSTIFVNNPSALVGTGNFVGSGTSFSAAITSGAAALVLSDHPGLSPDQLKARLLSTANPGPVGNPFVDGHGALDAAGADSSGPVNFSPSVGGLLPVLPGFLVPLLPNGPVDTWNVQLWTGLSVPPAPPGGATWNGTSWNGADWDGWVWTGRAWDARFWAGAAWNAGDWTGRAWNNAAWAGSAWNGSAWSGRGWNGSAWS
jgi:serine protease AprX